MTPAETLAAGRPGDRAARRGRRAGRPRATRTASPSRAARSARSRRSRSASPGAAGTSPPPMPAPRGRGHLRRRPRRARPGRHPVAAGGHRPDGGELPRRRRGGQRLRHQAGATVTVVDVGVAADLPDRARAGRTQDRVRHGRPVPGPGDDRATRPSALEAGIEVAATCGRRRPLPDHRRHGHRQHHRLRRPVCRVHRPGPGSSPAGAPASTTRRCGARSRWSAARAAGARDRPAVPSGWTRSTGAAPRGRRLRARGDRRVHPRRRRRAGAGDPRRRHRRGGRPGGGGARPRRASDYCVAGHRSAEPGHAAALEHLGLRPLVDLELRLGEGTGALLAHPLVCARSASCTRSPPSTRRASTEKVRRGPGRPPCRYSLEPPRAPCRTGRRTGRAVPARGDGVPTAAAGRCRRSPGGAITAFP